MCIAGLLGAITAFFLGLIVWFLVGIIVGCIAGWLSLGSITQGISEPRFWEGIGTIVVVCAFCSALAGGIGGLFGKGRITSQHSSLRLAERIGNIVGASTGVIGGLIAGYLTLLLRPSSEFEYPGGIVGQVVVVVTLLCGSAYGSWIFGGTGAGIADKIVYRRRSR
jgi:hypothetical protein